jgi:glycosyltransferase involved in cell wall biosynthesis
MKLAILGTRGIPARYGGFETFAERLSVGLAARGCNVTVYCEGNGRGRPEKFHGVHLRYIPAPDVGPLTTVLYDARCLWDAHQDFDVVYMLGYGAAPFCILPRLWKREVWINPDGLEWARPKWNRLGQQYFRLMEWVSMRAADRVIADAASIADSLRSRHQRVPPCAVIPYGCEVIEKPPPRHSLSEWRVDADGYYLVVCRLEPENHVLEILNAFRECGSKRQLVVAGNLKRNGYVEQLKSVNDRRIRMIGTVYDREKLACLRYHSFAYFHGHSVGGTNPSLLEAMGCGNLIFAHDNPFNRETLSTCGLYFTDAGELAEGIEKVETSGPDLASLKEAARKRARERYRWSGVIDRYEELLNGVLAKAA